MFQLIQVKKTLFWRDHYNWFFKQDIFDLLGQLQSNNEIGDAIKNVIFETDWQICYQSIPCPVSTQKGTETFEAKNVSVCK